MMLLWDARSKCATKVGVLCAIPTVCNCIHSTISNKGVRNRNLACAFEIMYIELRGRDLFIILLLDFQRQG